MNFDPTKPVIWIGYFDCTLGNPNGDPNFDNQARILSDGRGFITPTCYKRKVRNYAELNVSNASQQIYAKSGIALESFLKDEYTGIGVKDPKKTTEASKNELEANLLSKYFDLRLFGGVLSTGDHPANNIKTCCVVSPIISVNQIETMEIGITRCFTSKDKEITNKKLNQNMGSFNAIRYGLYKITVEYNPTLGAKNKVTAEDLFLLNDALNYLYLDDASAARRLKLQKIYCFTPDDKKYKIQNIEDSIEVVSNNDAPTSIKDFQFNVLNSQYLNDKFSDH